MTDTEIRFLLQIILLLLVLGMPPLTIWLGKTLHSLRGWQLTAVPVLVIFTLLLITFTAGGVQTVLKIDFDWDEANANHIGLAFVVFHIVTFVWHTRGGEPLPVDKGVQKGNGQGPIA